MAGNPNLISPEMLVEEGLLGRDDIVTPGFPLDAVDFSGVGAFKNLLLGRAWERFQAGAARYLQGEFDGFRDAESGWLDDFCLFTALKAVHKGTAWARWPREIAFRRVAALRDARRSLADDIGRRQFMEFIFFRQLDALRRQAKSLGVKLIGDLPIFVSGESADVWAHPGLFQLDKDRRAKFVAGVPPDYFSKTGQRWGNPLYNWAAMQRDGFRWWIARARMALRQADVVRIDHFRGFVASWTIPAREPTAEKGRWSGGAEAGRCPAATLGARAWGLAVHCRRPGPDHARRGATSRFPGPARHAHRAIRLRRRRAQPASSPQLRSPLCRIHWHP